MTTEKNWLAKKAVLATLNIRQWSARRLDRKVTDEINTAHNAVADAGRYNKLLIAKSAIEPISKIVNEARGAHVTMTQPWTDAGWRLLPASLYLKYTERLDGLHRDFDKAVDVFCRNYSAYVTKRERELGALFNKDDYPSEREIRGLFEFDVHFDLCPDPTDFRVELAASHADDIKRDIETRVKRGLEDAMKEPVRRVVDTVGRMAERLKAYKPADGDAKAKGVFRDTLVDNVRELVDLLPSFNLTGDKALDDLARNITTALCTHDAKELRESEHVRESVAVSAEAILARAKAMLA